MAGGGGGEPAPPLPIVQLQGNGWQADDSALSGVKAQSLLGEPVLWSSASESPSHWAPLLPGAARPKSWKTIGSPLLPEKWKVVTFWSG